MFLVMSLACAPYPDLEDAWTPTWEACGPLDPEVGPAPLDELPLSGRCVDRLVEDLGADPALLAREPLLAKLVVGAWNLLGRDMGRLDELEPGPWVREPLLGELRALEAALGTDEVTALTWSFVAYHVDHSTVAPADQPTVMAFDPRARTLKLHPEQSTWLAPVGWTHTLVHEAAHALHPRHVDCPALGLEQACDETWGGAYGLQVGAAELLRRACEPHEDPDCAALGRARDGQVRFILEE